MLLAIDVGNTQTHIGMFEGERLAEHWRLASNREATCDRLATELAGLLSLRDLRLRDVDGVIASVVVPTLAHEYELLADRYLPRQMMLVGPGVKTSMPIRIEHPHEVGADRLVNAVAAFERCGGPCIAVDFGTAVNYDVVSADGEYLGGVLAPGVEVSIDALAQRAARLFKVELESPGSVIGRSTQAALQSGIVFGFAGQVDGIIGRIREELGTEATAIATGGHAEIIAPHCDQIDEVDDLLTLTGLRLIWERNKG